MKVGVWRGLRASVLSYSVFVAVYLLVAFPKPPKPKPVRMWAAPHTLVSDSVIYGFVRELLGQSDGEFTNRIDRFYIRKVLLNRRADIAARGHLYPQSVILDSKTMQELCLKHKLLTQNDTLFMRRQQAYSAGFHWQQQLLPDYTILSADTLRSIREEDPFRYLRIVKQLHQQHKTSFFSFISMPLFSRDGRTVVIEVSYTDGILDGSGEIWVLQRRQGKWHKELLLDGWES